MTILKRERALMLKLRRFPTGLQWLADAKAQAHPQESVVESDPEYQKPMTSAEVFISPCSSISAVEILGTGYVA